MENTDTYIRHLEDLIKYTLEKIHIQHFFIFSDLYLLSSILTYQIEPEVTLKKIVPEKSMDFR